MTNTRLRQAQEMEQEVAHCRPLPAAVPRPVKRMSGRADTGARACNRGAARVPSLVRPFQNETNISV